MDTVLMVRKAGVRRRVTMHPPQSGSRDGSWYFLLFLPVVHTRTRVPGVALPTLRRVFPLHLNLSGNICTHILSQMCLSMVNPNPVKVIVESNCYTLPVHMTSSPLQNSTHNSQL